MMLSAFFCNERSQGVLFVSPLSSNYCKYELYVRPVHIMISRVVEKMTG